MSKRKSIVITILLTICVAVLGVMCFASFPIGKVKDYNSILSNIGKGIDLSGGYYVVLTPESTSGDENDSEVLDKAMDILRARLDNKGYTEAIISVQDGTKIRVEIPQVDEAEEVLQIIGQTGQLTFEDYDGYIWLNGEDHIKGAYVAQDREKGGFLVVLNFTDLGAARFSEATKKISERTDGNNRLSIFLGHENKDDKPISQPTVKEQITSTSAQIEGYETYEDALSIASVIDSGRLPIKYTISESRGISSKLGEGAIQNSAIMGAVGLAIIFIIMILRYRGMGVASSVALIIYVLLYIVFLAIIPSVQLTLPGIAGILLSIGMAVDSNIIIFERIREEFALGKTVEASIKQGFKHAVVTVFDSNITTIFAAIVLWALCPGAIKGFAITLLIGIALTLFTAILVTRWILRLFMPFAKDEERFLNLKRAEGGNN